MGLSKVDLLLMYLVENPCASNQQIASSMGMGESYVRTTISRQKQRGWLLISGHGENRRIEVLKHITADENKDQQKRIAEEVLDVQLKFFREAATFKKRLRVGNEIRELRKTIPGIGLAIADEMIEFYVDDLKQTEDAIEVEKISREIRMLLPELQGGKN